MANPPELNVNPQLFNSVMSGPVPGQSLTHEPKSQTWEKPAQHTNLEDAMDMLMTQLTEPEHLKQLLGLMEAGMPIEAIARTILFTGFTLGKWTPDLGILMYKPLMLALIAFAHRAGLKDTPVVMSENLNKHIHGKMKNYVMSQSMQKKDIGTLPKQDATPAPILKTANAGFFNRSAA